MEKSEQGPPSYQTLQTQLSVSLSPQCPRPYGKDRSFELISALNSELNAIDPLRGAFSAPL